MRKFRALCAIFVCALTMAIGFAFVNGNVTEAKADEATVVEYTVLKADNSWLKSDKRIAFQIDKNNRPTSGDYAINGGRITLERGGKSYKRTDGMTLTVYTNGEDCVAYMELWPFGNNLGADYTRNVGDVYTIEGQFGNIKIKESKIVVAGGDTLCLYEQLKNGVFENNGTENVSAKTASNFQWRAATRYIFDTQDPKNPFADGSIKPLYAENVLLIRNGVTFVIGNTAANCFDYTEWGYLAGGTETAIWWMPDVAGDKKPLDGDIVIIRGAFTDGTTVRNFEELKIKVVSDGTNFNQYVVHNCTFVSADGTKTTFEYDVTDREDVLAAMKKKVGKETAEWSYSSDLPEVLPEKNGLVYTETRTKKTYNVVWKNYDGAELKTDIVEYGVVPTYDGTPVKAADKDREYVFAGWDKEVVAVTDNVVYTAKFDTTEHEFGEWNVTENATCLEKGEREKTCLHTGCGYIVTEEVAALGHDMGEFVETKKATCTEKGEKTKTCKRDGCTYTETEEIAAHGHDMGEFVETKKATCTEKGEKTKTCKREGCTHKETEEIAALGHKLVKVDKVDATTEKEGVKEHYKCSACGALYADEAGTTSVTEEELVIAKTEKKNGGCGGSIDKSGIGLVILSIAAVAVLIKKRKA